MKKTSLLILTILVLGLIFAGCQNKTQDTGLSGAIVQSKIEKEDADKSDEQKAVESLDMAIADGTYIEEAQYQSPAGEEHIRISLEVEDNIITQLQIEPIDAENTHKISLKKMSDSSSGLQELVIGKKIDELDIPTQVSGSSLTTGAFKAKLTEMIEQY